MLNINLPKSGGARASRSHLFQHTQTVLTTKLGRHNEKLLYTNQIWLSIRKCVKLPFHLGYGNNCLVLFGRLPARPASAYIFLVRSCPESGLLTFYCESEAQKVESRVCKWVMMYESIKINQIYQIQSRYYRFFFTFISSITSRFLNFVLTFEH